MNDIRTTEHHTGISSPHRVHGEFEELLGKAEECLQEQEVARALAILVELQKRYVASVRLFDLLGEALLRQGKTEAAFRNKALHQVLKGVYLSVIPDSDDMVSFLPPASRMRADEASPLQATDICASGKNRDLSPLQAEDTRLEPAMTDTGDLAGRRSAPPPARQQAGGQDGLPRPACANHSTELQDSLFPVTLAMGHEFLRQGHFHRAQEIFRVLSERHPGDPSIAEALESAMKKNREKQLLGVFQRWLKNIEMMKSPPPS
ncbi:MAG: hypothetical protein AB1646_18515 [Thermodesulfobacteriota bacterium]